MNITRKLFQISIPKLTIQSSGLVILYALVHTVSDMGFSAGAAGLIYIGVGRLQEIIGLLPAIRIAYLALIGAAVMATLMLKSCKEMEESPWMNSH